MILFRLSISIEEEGLCGKKKKKKKGLCGKKKKKVSRLSISLEEEGLSNEEEGRYGERGILRNFGYGKEKEGKRRLVGMFYIQTIHPFDELILRLCISQSQVDHIRGNSFE
jgi:hypothetical protein